MLKKETIEGLAKYTGLSASDFEAKIKSEGEEDVTLPKFNVFTDEQLTERVKNEKTSSYNEGKTAGVEMIVKDKKKELGYEFEGKDFSSLFDHHTKKIQDENKNPDKKVTELKQDIENMKTAHQNEVEKISGERDTFKGQVSSLKTSNSLMGIIPANTTLAKDDLITLFNASHNITEEEGKVIVKRNGETLKDPTTASPIPLNDVFLNWATEKKYVSGTPGRGGGNEGGDNKISANSISSFQEQWQKKNPEKSLNDAKYQEDYATWREETKEPQQ